jgi:CcmD family protein
MADAMLENGKIYVVIAVLCTVFMGLVVYTIMIDRKLSKLEKEVNEK